MTSSANFAGASQLLSSIQSWQTIQEWGQHSVWLVPGCTQKLLYTWYPPTQVREYTIATVHLTPTYSGQRVHRNYCTRDTRLLMSESTQKLYLTLLYSWSDSTQKLHLNLFVLFYLFLKCGQIVWSGPDPSVHQVQGLPLQQPPRPGHRQGQDVLYIDCTVCNV